MPRRRPKLRTKGEVYRPAARVLKVRRGRPTVLLIHGERYVVQPRGVYLGPKGDGGGSGFWRDAGEGT